MSDVQVTVTVGSQTLFSCSVVSAVDAMTSVIQQLQLALGHFQTQKPTPITPVIVTREQAAQIQDALKFASDTDAARRQAAGM